jgi:hypothetical protein
MEEAIECQRLQSSGGVKIQRLADGVGSRFLVKSVHTNVGRQGTTGAVYGVHMHSGDELRAELAKIQVLKKSTRRLHGYFDCGAARIWHVGFGEKNAKAFDRESVPALLKGSFAQAISHHAIAAARIRGRGGSSVLVSQVFENEWGLTPMEMALIPIAHLAGSEATRLSAAAGKAYRGVSAHPACTGGLTYHFAPVAKDAFGPSIPISYQRLRATMKAAALLNMQCDMMIQLALARTKNPPAMMYYMDAGLGSHKPYERVPAWEMDEVDKMRVPRAGKAVSSSVATFFDENGVAVDEEHDELYQLLELEDETVQASILEDMRPSTSYLSRPLLTNAEIVELSKKSGALCGTRFQQEAVYIASEMDNAREALAVHREAQRVEGEVLYNEEGDIAGFVELPDIMIRRETTAQLMASTQLTGKRGADFAMGTEVRPSLSMQSMRNLGIDAVMSVADSFRLALYLRAVMTDRSTRAAMYKLMVNVSIPKSTEKVARILNEPSFFPSGLVTEVLTEILDDTFVSMFRTLLVSNPRHKAGIQVKKEIWRWLSVSEKGERGTGPGANYEELIKALPMERNAWRLAYQLRVTAGRMHYSACSGLTTTLLAGRTNSMAVCMRKSLEDKLERWRACYTAFAEKKAKDLKSGVSVQEDFQAVAEDQFKARVYSVAKASTVGNRLTLQMPLRKLDETMIDVYKSRHERINRTLLKHKSIKFGTALYNTHPWGKKKDLTGLSHEELLATFEALDPAGWTIEPRKMYAMATDVLRETMDDVRKECKNLLSLADAAFEQNPDQLDLQAQLFTHSLTVVDVDPEVPPYINLGRRRVFDNLHSEETATRKDKRPLNPNAKVFESAIDRQFVHPGTAFYATLETPPLPSEASTSSTPVVLKTVADLQREEMLEVLKKSVLAMTTQAKRDTVAHVPTDRYLTLREIAVELKVQEHSDEELLSAFIPDAGVTLDQPYAGNALGPAVPLSKRRHATKLWRPFIPRLRLMLRLEILPVEEPVDTSDFA